MNILHSSFTNFTSSLGLAMARNVHLCSTFHTKTLLTYITRHCNILYHGPITIYVLLHRILVNRQALLNTTPPLHNMRWVVVFVNIISSWNHPVCVQCLVVTVTHVSILNVGFHASWRPKDCPRLKVFLAKRGTPRLYWDDASPRG